MRSIRFPGQGHISLVERPEPQPGAGEVLLRIQRTALCGSDCKLWQRGTELVPGHEIFGTVDQPGHARHGQRCCVFIPVHCGHCASCTRGDTHLCRTDSVLMGWTRDGGYHEVNLKECHDWTREGCTHCPDFAAEHADISTGGIGKDNDWTLTIVRTELGREVISRMIADGSIIARPGDEDPAAIALLHKLAEKSRARWPQWAETGVRLGLPEKKAKA